MNQFVIWDVSYDKTAPFLSNPNFHPKQTFVQNNFASRLGRGNWQSCTEAVVEGLAWARESWDLLLEHGSSRSSKAFPGDRLNGTTPKAFCHSSTDLTSLFPGQKFQLVITDPPFGYNLGYSDMAEFFYVWLRLGVPEANPGYFKPERTPRARGDNEHGRTPGYEKR